MTLSEQLKSLVEKTRRPNAEQSDRFALRSHLEAHLPTILAALEAVENTPETNDAL